MNEIITIANKYGVPVIEDAAEALGAEVNKKIVETPEKLTKKEVDILVVYDL